MDIEREIKGILARNRRVEADKAWEISKTRRLFITLLTYFVMVCVMNSLGLSAPFINALIPTFGFLLSTLSVGLVKRFWIKRFDKEMKEK